MWTVKQEEESNPSNFRAEGTEKDVLELVKPNRFLYGLMSTKISKANPSNSQRISYFSAEGTENDVTELVKPNRFLYGLMSTEISKENVKRVHIYNTGLSPPIKIEPNAFLMGGHMDIHSYSQTQTHFHLLRYSPHSSE